MIRLLSLLAISSFLVVNTSARGIVRGQMDEPRALGYSKSSKGKGKGKKSKKLKSMKKVKKAKNDYIIDDYMTVLPKDNVSNSGAVLEEECGEPDPHRYAFLQVSQCNGESYVHITVKNARPHTVYTAWVRLKGTGPDGSEIGPNPVTGGGATPIAPGTSLDSLIAVTPPYDGTMDPENGFLTDEYGYGELKIMLDFPLLGGAYPFQRATEEDVRMWEADAGGNVGDAMLIPSPIVDPRDPDIDGQFFIRVVSHCQDNFSHGLVPADRETWFEYP